MSASPRYPLLALEQVEQALRLAQRLRIPVDGEFAAAFRDVNGDGSKLSEAWLRRRVFAVSAELRRMHSERRRWARASRRLGALHDMLRLAAWGYAAHPAALDAALQTSAR